MTAEQLREDLEGALSYLRDYGWTQNQYRAPGGKVCAIGAIAGNLGLLHGYGVQAVVVADTPRFVEALTALVNTLSPAYGRMLTLYNDNPCRNQEDIEFLFEKAIASLPASQCFSSS